MTFDSLGAASFALEISLRAAAAALAVAVVLRVLRIHAAAVRHAAWSAVLAAMLLMPALPSLLPAVPLPLPAALTADVVDMAVAEDASPSLPVSNATAAVPTVNANAGSPAAVEPFRASPPVPTRALLPLFFLAVYAGGVLLFAARLFHGWRLVSRMILRARRVDARAATVPAPVVESAEVAVPMTAGALRPVIVLPLAWREWPSDTLAAVLAHEMAHIRRRDALIAVLARLNRAIFWFHPLAWWLERKLAVTAEHACDEAAARVVEEPRRYAEILLDMADAVRRNRGRMVWQGVGVTGGVLQARIERVLRAEAFGRTSAARTAAALVACAAVILLVVACKQQIAAAPLKEDPELARQLAQQDDDVKKFEAARDMTQAAADALEQKIAANPGDFDTRRQLVTYYQASSNVSWDKKVPGLRRHALWLIEHHPEHDVRPPSLSPQYDPEGFASATQLWSAHVSKPGASAFLIYRAASFFKPHDKARAEELVLRGMAMDPESAALKARIPPRVAGYEWPSQLSDLYASAVAGSESVWGTINDLRTHLDRLETPFAVKVRQQLEASTDARLLARVGSRLTQRRGYSKDPAIKAAEDQTRALGVRYLERAVQLDPTLETAKMSLFVATSRETLTEADRMANGAHERYMISEDITEYAKKDPEKAKAERAQATRDARAVLDMAKAHPGDPAYSAAVMTAHHLLAVDALREEDRDKAIFHLRESLKVPASDQIKYAPPFSWMRPVNRLLKEGERERVVEFLEGYAQLTVRERQRLLDDAKAIREGRMPMAYQHMIYRESTPSPFKLR